MTTVRKQRLQVLTKDLDSDQVFSMLYWFLDNYLTMDLIQIMNWRKQNKLPFIDPYVEVPDCWEKD